MSNKRIRNKFEAKKRKQQIFMKKFNDFLKEMYTKNDASLFPHNSPVVVKILKEMKNYANT
jgi:hypothetical protein